MTTMVMGRREAARVFGLSRETVLKMCRFSLPPGCTRTRPVTKPKLGPLLSVIDTILEMDRTGPVKQRHTAKRIFERLRDEQGFGGGYTVVKDYVRIARARGRETFVPLSHPPGHAQVDFGEAVGVIWWGSLQAPLLLHGPAAVGCILSGSPDGGRPVTTMIYVMITGAGLTGVAAAHCEHILQHPARYFSLALAGELPPVRCSLWPGFGVVARR